MGATWQEFDSGDGTKKALGSAWREFDSPQQEPQGASWKDFDAGGGASARVPSPTAGGFISPAEAADIISGPPSVEVGGKMISLYQNDVPYRNKKQPGFWEDILPKEQPELSDEEQIKMFRSLPVEEQAKIMMGYYQAGTQIPPELKFIGKLLEYSTVPARGVSKAIVEGAGPTFPHLAAASAYAAEFGLDPLMYAPIPGVKLAGKGVMALATGIAKRFPRAGAVLGEALPVATGKAMFERVNKEAPQAAMKILEASRKEIRFPGTSGYLSRFRGQPGEIMGELHGGTGIVGTGGEEEGLALMRAIQERSAKERAGADWAKPEPKPEEKTAFQHKLDELEVERKANDAMAGAQKRAAELTPETIQASEKVRKVYGSRVQALQDELKANKVAYEEGVTQARQEMIDQYDHSIEKAINDAIGGGNKGIQGKIADEIASAKALPEGYPGKANRINQLQVELQAAKQGAGIRFSKDADYYGELRDAFREGRGRMTYLARRWLKRGGMTLDELAGDVAQRLGHPRDYGWNEGPAGLTASGDAPSNMLLHLKAEVDKGISDFNNRDAVIRYAASTNQYFKNMVERMAAAKEELVALEGAAGHMKNIERGLADVGTILGVKEQDPVRAAEAIYEHFRMAGRNPETITGRQIPLGEQPFTGEALPALGGPPPSLKDFIEGRIPGLRKPTEPLPIIEGSTGRLNPMPEYSFAIEKPLVVKGVAMVPDRIMEKVKRFAANPKSVNDMAAFPRWLQEPGKALQRAGLDFVYEMANIAEKWYKREETAISAEVLRISQKYGLKRANNLDWGVFRVLNWGEKAVRKANAKVAKGATDKLTNRIATSGMINDAELEVAVKAAAEFRALFDRLGVEFGLAKGGEKWVENYVPHLIQRILQSEGAVAKGTELEMSMFHDVAGFINADMSRLPSDITNKHLIERLGANDYVESTLEAIGAYTRAGLRRKYLTAPLNVMRTVMKAGVPQGTRKYVTEYGLRYMGAPRVFEEYTGSMVKGLMNTVVLPTMKATFERVPGGYADQAIKRVEEAILQPDFLVGRRASSHVREWAMVNLLGWAPDSAFQNLTQTVNTYAELGRKYTQEGMTMLWRSRTDPELKALLKASGVLDDASFRKILDDERMGGIYRTYADRSMGLFQYAEQINRGSAFFGGYAKAKAEGAGVQDAIKFGVDVSNRTQFSFLRSDTPLLFQTGVGRFAFQLGQYPLRQIQMFNPLATGGAMLKGAAGKTLSLGGALGGGIAGYQAAGVPGAIAGAAAGGIAGGRMGMAFNRANLNQIERQNIERMWRYTWATMLAYGASTATGWNFYRNLAPWYPDPNAPLGFRGGFARLSFGPYVGLMNEILSMTGGKPAQDFTPEGALAKLSWTVGIPRFAMKGIQTGMKSGLDPVKAAQAITGTYDVPEYQKNMLR